MADQDLSLTFSVDSSAATDGIAQVNTALEQTATDAQAAGTAAAAAGQAITDGTAAAAPALSAVDQAAKNLNDSMDRLATAMANPNSGPRVLFKDAATAQMALTALQQAAASTGTSLDSLGINVDNVKQELLDAATKSATFTLELGKLRAAGLEGANQLQALQGKASSLSAMFLEMSRTGNATEQSIGKMAVGVGIGILAFDVAVATGQKLSKTLVELVDAWSAADAIGVEAEQNLNLVANALAAAAAGHIKYAASMAGTIANYKIYEAEQTKSTGALADFTAALKKLTPATDMTQAIANEVAFGEALSVAFNKGKVEESLFLEAHKTMVANYIATQQHMGEIVPQAWQDITTAMKNAEAAQALLSEKGAASIITSLSEIMAKQKEADNAANMSAVAAQGHFEAAMRQLNQETLSSEEYSDKKTELYNKMAEQEQLAADKQAVADAEAALAQAKLQAQLGLADDAMGIASKAATDYSTAIDSGVRPSTALKDSVALLQATIHDTGVALPDLNDSFKKLAEQGMKEAGDQAKAAKDQTQDLRLEIEKTNIATSDLAKAVGALNTVWGGLGSFAKPAVKALQDFATAMSIIRGIVDDSGGNPDAPLTQG
jgi:hypothetical protein